MPHDHWKPPDQHGAPDLRLHAVEDTYHVRPIWISAPSSDTGGHWVSSAPEAAPLNATVNRAWRPVGRADRQRQFVTAILANEQALMQLDSWVPFPQTTCFAVFGDGNKPLPLGALVALWHRCPDFTGRCPLCGGRLYGYTIGGILRVAGVSACCVNCGAGAQRSLGTAVQAVKAVASYLRDTPYYMRAVIPNGACAGASEPLVRALRELGWSSQRIDPDCNEAAASAYPEIPVPEFPHTLRTPTRRLRAINATDEEINNEKSVNARSGARRMSEGSFLIGRFHPAITLVLATGFNETTTYRLVPRGLRDGLTYRWVREQEGGYGAGATELELSVEDLASLGELMQARLPLLYKGELGADGIKYTLTVEAGMASGTWSWRNRPPEGCSILAEIVKEITRLPAGRSQVINYSDMVHDDADDADDADGADGADGADDVSDYDVDATDDDDDEGAAELLEAIADALHTNGTMPAMKPEEMLDRLHVTVPNDFTYCACETSGCFDLSEAAEYLYGHVSGERMDDLHAGASLTREELAVAREEFRRSLEGQESGLSVYLYSLRDRRGRTVCFTSAHGDGGYLIGVGGPFASLKEAKDARMSNDDDECMTHIDWY